MEHPDEKDAHRRSPRAQTTHSNGGSRASLAANSSVSVNNRAGGVGDAHVTVAADERQSVSGSRASIQSAVRASAEVQGSRTRITTDDGTAHPQGVIVDDAHAIATQQQHGASTPVRRESAAGVSRASLSVATSQSLGGQLSQSAFTPLSNADTERRISDVSGADTERRISAAIGDQKLGSASEATVGQVSSRSSITASTRPITADTAIDMRDIVENPAVVEAVASSRSVGSSRSRNVDGKDPMALEVTKSSTSLRRGSDEKNKQVSASLSPMVSRRTSVANGEKTSPIGSRKSSTGAADASVESPVGSGMGEASLDSAPADDTTRDDAQHAHAASPPPPVVVSFSKEAIEAKSLPTLEELLASIERDVDGGESDAASVSASTEGGHGGVNHVTAVGTVPPEPLDVDEKRKAITRMREELEKEEIARYEEDFERQLREEALIIGSLSVEEVREQERQMRLERLQLHEENAAIQKRRQQALALAEERAKRKVTEDLKAKTERVVSREILAAQREKNRHDEIRKTFRRAEDQLLHVLQERKAEVTTLYGHLTYADGQYGGVKGRRLKLDWDRTPQPVQIKLGMIRAVKDKISGGRYVLMVSLYDRLGGHVMKWSSLKGQEWGASTLPVEHNGRHFDVELHLDQSVYTVCPARPDIRPGMVVVYELFLLRGIASPVDKVVGWGAFPIADAEFSVIEGKQMCPLMRGDVDLRIDKHSRLEEIVASDIDSWLGNLYFEVVRLPRYFGGQKEYEVELQFTSSLLGFPNRTEGSDEETEEVSESKVTNGAGLNGYGAAALESIANLKRSTVDASALAVGTSQMNSVARHRQVGSMRSFGRTETALSTGAAALGQNRLGFLDETEEDDGNRESNAAGAKSLARMQLSKSHLGQSLGQSMLSRKSENADEDVDSLMWRENAESRLVPEGPGLSFRVHERSPADVSAASAEQWRVREDQKRRRMLARNARARTLTDASQFEDYRFAIRAPFGARNRQNANEKLQYVRRQLLAELGISQWRSREFWAALFLLFAVFWGRLYVHYFGQWLYLQSRKIPVATFKFLAYSTVLLYQGDLLPTSDHIAIFCVGPLFVALIFVLLVGVVYVSQRTVRTFPNLGCRLVLAFGIASILDPILICIVDTAMQRYKNEGEMIGDAFKLYWHFDEEQGSGLVGIFLTVFIYACDMFLGCVLCYVYFLKWHLNGRMLDVYHRLHGEPGDFFVPNDMEISNQELRYICTKAEQWRGEQGERRKVIVNDHIYEEEDAHDREGDARDAPNAPTATTGAQAKASTARQTATKASEDGRKRREKDKLFAQAQPKREVTTHVSIYTLYLDGSKELYRHFLRLPDGAIVEVFGDIDSMGLDGAVKKSLERQKVTLKGMLSQSLQSLERKERGSTSLSARGDGRGSTASGGAIGTETVVVDDTGSHGRGSIGRSSASLRARRSEGRAGGAGVGVGVSVGGPRDSLAVPKTSISKRSIESLIPSVSSLEESSDDSS
eukprot:Opistho-2@91791